MKQQKTDNCISLQNLVFKKQTVLSVNATSFAIDRKRLFSKVRELQLPRSNCIGDYIKNPNQFFL